MGIYVEILIRAPIDAVWDHTQQPSLHERWDLRFSSIEYLPKASAAAPQRFRYTTRVGGGLQVAGDGESVGTRDLADGSRTSALRFWSHSPLALIAEGSGYWKYIPAADGVRFLTWYDYRPRWGAVGRIVDAVVFRPLLGWATAWSFDRLRGWLEDGIEPARTARQAVVHGVARSTLAFVFAYQGLVPKLLGPDADEIVMAIDGGIGPDAALAVVLALGALELVFAGLLLATWRRAWAPRLALLAMVLATATVIVASPWSLGAAFNPITLNLTVAALAVIDLLTLPGLASAARCRRRPPGDV